MIFIQLSGTRTGSTFFYRCLNSHPDIEAYPEMYRIDSNKRSDYLLDPTYMGYRKITFKLMYNHCKHFKLIDKIIDVDMPIIHVMRRNSYRKVLSDLVSNIINGESSYIEPQKFSRLIKEYDILKETYRDLMSNNTKYIEFYMEDFISPDSTMTTNESDRLCKFLGVGHKILRSDSKKLTPNKNHWDYIDNADELKGLINQ